MTAQSMVTGLVLSCRFGFTRTDFGLPPPSPALFLRAVEKKCDPLAWVYSDDRFSFDAIISSQNANGRYPLLPRFAASVVLTEGFAL